MTVWSELNDMSAAVGIDAFDIAAIQRNLHVIDDILPDAVADLYSHLHDRGLDQPFRATDVRHLAERQVAHWEALFAGRFDTIYFDNATRIGSLHQRHAVTHEAYIAAYGWFLMRVLSRIDGRDDIAGSPAALRAAVVKYVFLDLTIAAATERKAETAAIYMDRAAS